jgi:hypothetical protein
MEIVIFAANSRSHASVMVFLESGVGSLVFSNKAVSLRKFMWRGFLSLSFSFLFGWFLMVSTVQSFLP